MTDIATLEREAAEHAAKVAEARAVIAEEQAKAQAEHAERVRVASAEFLAATTPRRPSLRPRRRLPTGC